MRNNIDKAGESGNFNEPFSTGAFALEPAVGKKLTARFLDFPPDPKPTLTPSNTPDGLAAVLNRKT